MKNISLILISTIISGAILQSNAQSTSLIEQLEKKESGKTPSVPLYPESEEIMVNILDQNEVYKKVEAGRKVAPESAVLNAIKSHSTQYIEDLKKGLIQVEKTESPIERQKIIEDIHYRNNPLESFYY